MGMCSMPKIKTVSNFIALTFAVKWFYDVPLSIIKSRGHRH